MRPLSLPASLLLFLTAAALPTSAAAQATFTGICGSPLAISADGSTAVGSLLNLSDRVEAFRWSTEDGLTLLGLPPGAVSSTASDVSADGSVVAGSWATTFPPAPARRSSFRWTAADGLVDIDPTATDSLAAGISGDGLVITGRREAGSAYRWTEAGGIVLLPPNPEGRAPIIGKAASADGSAIVGSAGNEAFRWTVAGGTEALVDSNFSDAWNLSGDGSVVVGQFDAVGLFTDAFRWTAATGAVALGAAGDVQFVNGEGVSDDGSVIVGAGRDAGFDRSAMIWDPVNGPRVLRQVLIDDFGLAASLEGWELITAEDVSADGRVITGTGVNPQGRSEGWVVFLDGGGAMADPLECPANSSQARTRALREYLDDDASCAPATDCERPFAAARDKLTRALDEFARERPQTAATRISSAVAPLERRGFAIGELAARIDETTSAMAAEAQARVDEIAERAAGLCASQRVIVERRLARPFDLLETALDRQASNRWASALSSLGRVFVLSAAAGRTAESAEARCRPRACRSDDFVQFTPGPGDDCLTLVPPDRGVEACYDLTSSFGFEGNVCVDHLQLNRFRVSGQGEIPGSFARDLSGTGSTRSCTDSAGWTRIQRLDQGVLLTPTFPGAPGARERSSFTASFDPPPAAFFSGLLPAPAAAIELCVGDRMDEQYAFRGSRRGPVRLTGACTATHRVEAIEDPGVSAGSFTAARVVSDYDCDIETCVRQECLSESQVDTVTTWLASEAGPIRIESSSAGLELISLDTP